MSKQLQIRNSTAEFLIFQAEDKTQGVQVFYQDENIWATQDAIATLFDKGRTTITEHLKHIFESGELDQNSVCRKFRLTAADGKNYETQFYNLDAIISVGYRVNSIRATQFRRWATSVLRQFAIKGYVLDRKRMENGAFLSEDYFEHLLAEIHEIRLSERRFYQKLTDIYATSMDYDKDAPMTRQFFQIIQNKMHYAVHQHTAAELIMERASAEKEHMGLTTWENAPSGKIVKTDVSIAKNYLKQNELEDMGNIVSAVLDFAEARAKRHIPMTMEDWAKRIDAYLNSDERPLLTHAGSVSHEAAKEYAETEFEKYRVVQDRLFESDFDRFALPTLPFDGENKD
ncbi:MAG: virulence RhuM family protein [Paludibacteraceae bacterium]|nr:virulence RhuM family protein [Paludibacteraceae bacterium]